MADPSTLQAVSQLQRRMDIQASKIDDIQASQHDMQLQMNTQMTELQALSSRVEEAKSSRLTRRLGSSLRLSSMGGSGQSLWLTASRVAKRRSADKTPRTRDKTLSNDYTDSKEYLST